MTRMPPNASRVDPRLDPVFVERERNRFAARALAFLVLLNGAAALVMLAILANAPASTVEPKFATAMLFFGGGAIAALLSSFLAYINRTVAMEAPQRASLRQALLILAILAVIGSGRVLHDGDQHGGDGGGGEIELPPERTQGAARIEGAARTSRRIRKRQRTKQRPKPSRAKRVRASGCRSSSRSCFRD